MSAITAGAYAEWIATLTGSDLAAALAAGLDAQPSDEHSKYSRSGSEVREYDGLPVFLKNGSVHPLQHEATRDHTIEEVEDYDIAKDTIVPELAAALRRVFAFIIGGMGPQEIFKHSRTIAQRTFIVCRAEDIHRLPRNPTRRLREAESGRCRRCGGILSRQPLESRRAISRCNRQRAFAFRRPRAGTKNHVGVGAKSVEAAARRKRSEVGTDSPLRRGDKR